MAVVLFVIRSVFVVVWILSGLLTELLVFPLLSRRWRLWVVGAWSRGLLALCGVRVRVLGQPLRKGPGLWVANHVSWV
ncbi:MAG: 1-acyl-sn-glycerol-3-phosphate acyltransferase, partial [Castellaniella sp.]